MKEMNTLIFFFLLNKCSYFCDDSWRSCIFSLAKGNDKKELLKNDRKIRNKMIQEEEKIKKYLIKNDFDVMKGFLEFFKELNKSMVFKLSRQYNDNEVEEFFDKISYEYKGLNWSEVTELKKILVKTLVYDIKISQNVEDEDFELGFYQEISKTQNQDFDEAINMMLSGTRNLAEIIMNLS